MTSGKCKAPFRAVAESKHTALPKNLISKEDPPNRQIGLTLNSLNIAGIPRMSSVTIFQSDHFVLSTNFLFKFNVSLPLVTGELPIINTVDVNNVTYKLYNIKL